MSAWTSAGVRAWAEAHLPKKFRSCHVGAAAEQALGHWSAGQGILAALRRFGHLALVDGWDVPHANGREGRSCQGRKRGNAWTLIPIRESDEVRAERMREMCDSEGIE